MHNFALDFLLSAMRISLPLTLAAMGGFWSEKSGIAQVGLEGFLLLGALCGASFAELTHSLGLSFALTLFVGGMAGILFYLLAQRLKINQILVGLIFNLLIAGIAPFVTKIAFGSTGSTPSMDPALKWTVFPYFWVAFCFVSSRIIFGRTGFGLLVKFAGEKPAVIESAGYSLNVVRLLSLVLCGILTASGGFILSTYLASSYSPMMSAGRGFIALAALIFAGWNLNRAFIMAIVFGLLEALQIYLQGFDLPIPNQFFQSLPYLMTVVILLFNVKGQYAPTAIGKD